MQSTIKRWGVMVCIVFVATLLLTFISPSSVFAEPIKDETFAGSEFQSKMEQAMDEANIFERFIMNLINSVFKLTGLAPITELVYGNPYQYWIANDAGELKFGLFFEKEIELIIQPVMTVFIGLYTTAIVIAILLSTLKMGVVRPHSPQAVSDFWRDIQMWVLSAIFMFAIWDVVNILSGFNMGIVKVFNDLLTSQGISTSGISIVASATETTWNPIIFLNLGDIIIYLGEWILGAMLNFIYLARKITILILLLLSPLVAYALLYARTRQFFSVWLKEMCGNIFLQSMHALLMYGIAVIASMGATVLVKLFLLCLFIPLSGLLSKMLNLGDSSSRIGQSLTMTGLSSVGGLIALAGSGKRAFGNNGATRNGANPSSSDGGSSSGNGSLTGPSANDYSVGGLTHRRENGLNRAISLTRTAATIAGATVGSLAGMVAGPGGAVVGGMIGSKLGGMPVDMADNFGRGASNTIKSIKDYNAFKKTDPNKENLVGQRFHKGQIGASIGQMIGGNRGAAIGKKIGIGASGVTRRSAAINQFKGRSLEDLAKSNPGASFYQKVDSQKSAFYMRNANGEDELVSTFGSGIAGLENPVYVDYQAPQAGTVLTQMGNGRYSAAASVSTSSGSQASVQASTNANIDRNAGLSGSSQYLLRKSDAYTMDANGNRHDYRDYDASKTNPDSYFNHGAEGMKTGTFGGRVIDKMRNTPTATEAKSRSEYNQKLAQVAAEAAAKRGTRRKALP